MKKRKQVILIAGVLALAAAAGSVAVADGVKAGIMEKYASIIDIKAAIDAAVDATGLYSDEVYVTKAELDTENGNLVYEVELVTQDGKAEFDISAADGSVIKTDYSRKPLSLASGGTANTADGAAKALDIAFDHAGVAKADAAVKKSKLDHENGRFVYEIEFYAADKEYEYEIDAESGEIIEYQVKASKKAVKPAETTTAGEKISLERAKEIAFDHAGVQAANVMVKKAKLDRDDGVDVYELEFYTSSREFEYEISAADGRIVEYDVDYRD